MRRTLTLSFPFTVWLLAGCTGGPDKGEPEVANRAPTAPDVTIGPVDARTDDELVATMRVPSRDEDGDTVSYTYAWFEDGLVRPDLTADRVPASETARGELWEVTVTPTDGTVTGPAATASVTILNTAPTAAVALANGAPRTDEDLVASVETTDADGDDVTLTYVWTRDGGTVNATTSTVPADATARGERWTVTVTPSDDADAGDSVSAEAVIANSGPVLASVTLSTTAPTESDTLSATLGPATDDDGDPVTLAYAWLVDGVSVASSETLSATAFSKGDSIALVVTPWDGTAWGAPVSSATATAVNTPPVVSSVSLSPEAAYTDDVLVASAFGSDLDGDGIAFVYDWYVDGTLVQSGASASLDGRSAFSRDEEVRVVVTPNDGDTDGADVTSAALTVLNTPPSPPVVAVTPDDAGAGDDLTCSVVAAAVDADGDLLTYSFAWDVDGTPYTSALDAVTTSTVDGVDVVGESTWSCEAEASDGDAAATSSSDSVTICTPDYALTFSGGSTGTCCCTGGNAGNSYILADVTPALSGATTATIEFWLNLDTYTQYGTIMKAMGSSGPSIENTSDCGYGANRYKTAAGWAGSTLWSRSVATLGAWQHYALVYDAGTLRYYIDGALQSSASVPTTVPTISGNVLYFGGWIDASNGNNQQQVNGSYRSIRISSSARYRSAFTPEATLAADADTLHLYNLDEGSGYIVEDSVDPTYTGTIVNGSRANETWELYAACR